MANNNGHKKGGIDLADPAAINPIQAGGIGLFKEGELEAQLQNVDQTSMATLFVSAGKDARELFARTNIKDDNEINKFVMYYARCKKWGIENGKDMLQNKLAMRKSQGGLSMDQILQLGTGSLRQDRRPFNGKKLSKKEQEEQESERP